MQTLKENIAYLYPNNVEGVFIRTQNIIENFKAETQIQKNINLKNNIILTCKFYDLKTINEDELNSRLEFLNKFAKDIFDKIYIFTSENLSDNDLLTINSLAIQKQLPNLETINTLDFSNFFMFDKADEHTYKSDPEMFYLLIRKLLSLITNGHIAINLDSLTKLKDNLDKDKTNTEEIDIIIKITKKILQQATSNLWLFSKDTDPIKINDNKIEDLEKKLDLICQNQIITKPNDSTQINKWLKENSENEKIPFLNSFSIVEKENINITKYLAFQAIILSLQSVTCIGFHDLFVQDKTETKNSFQNLTNKLNDNSSDTYKIYAGLKKLISTRINEKLFSKNTEREIFDIHEKIIAISRYHEDSKLLALINVSDEEIKIESNILNEYFLQDNVTEIIRNQKISLTKSLFLRPNQIAWLK